jgi:hypothetical protein
MSVNVTHDDRSGAHKKHRFATDKHMAVKVKVTRMGADSCEINCKPAVSILQLKAKIQVQTGLQASLLSLYLPQRSVQPLGDSETLEDLGSPSELCAIVLQRVEVAIDIAGVAPSELTDAQLVKACSSPQVQGGDIIILKGAVQLHDVQCLAPLEQMHAFDISGCTTIKAAAVATMVAAHK